MEDVLDTYASQQGWNDESCRIHLIGYLEFCVERECTPDPDDFAEYLTRVADEESLVL